MTTEVKLTTDNKVKNKGKTTAKTKSTRKKATSKVSTKKVGSRKTTSSKKAVVKKTTNKKSSFDMTTISSLLTKTLIDLKNHHHEIGWQYFELNNYELLEKTDLKLSDMTEGLNQDLLILAKDVLYDNALEGDMIVVDHKPEYKIRFFVDNLDPSRRLYKDTK